MLFLPVTGIRMLQRAGDDVVVDEDDDVLAPLLEVGNENVDVGQLQPPAFVGEAAVGPRSRLVGGEWRVPVWRRIELGTIRYPWAFPTGRCAKGVIATDCVAVTEPPETQYAKTADGVHIAYQVLGHGPLDLVLVPAGLNHVELTWEMPAFARTFRRLASFSRLIRFDHRGSGMSDPFGRSEQPSLEERAEEMVAVLAAAGSERAAVVANISGGLVAVFFAASYPNRITSLVLDGCYARLARASDYPWGVPREVLEQALTRVDDARVGTGDFGSEVLRYMAPHADAEFVAQFRRYSHYAFSPAALRAESEMFVYADVRPLLSAIQAPTLVLYRSGDQFAGKPHAAYLFEHIGGAKLVELPGDDNLMFAGDSDADLDEIEEFLTGARHAPQTDRVLATVLFTDIVGSTETSGRSRRPEVARVARCPRPGRASATGTIPGAGDQHRRRRVRRHLRRAGTGHPLRLCHS